MGEGPLGVAVGPLGVRVREQLRVRVSLREGVALQVVAVREGADGVREGVAVGAAERLGLGV